VDCPKRIQILIFLNKNRKDGILSMKYWKSVYEIMSMFEKSSGRLAEIIKELVFSGILKKDEKGFYYNRKRVEELYMESDYFTFVREHDFHDIFD